MSRLSASLTVVLLCIGATGCAKGDGGPAAAPAPVRYACGSAPDLTPEHSEVNGIRLSIDAVRWNSDGVPVIEVAVGAPEAMDITGSARANRWDVLVLREGRVAGGDLGVVVPDTRSPEQGRPMVGRTFHIPAPEPFRETFVAERFAACGNSKAPECELVLMGSGMVIVPPRTPPPLRIDTRLTARHRC